MQLHIVDILIIVLYLGLSLGIGLYFTRRASKDTTSFFAGGRSVVWWLGGLSMVATTFAADTPLAVTELVRKGGIAGNWIWWSALTGGMMTVFFFARYWRRAGVTTDLELISIRYSGKEAHILRGFKAVYFGLFLNAVIMGWVNLALMTILKVYFNIPEETALLWVAGAMLLTTFYSALSGLLGVIYTDAVQFVLAMAGCIVLAVLVMQSPEIGGSIGLREKLDSRMLAFFPFGSEHSAGISGWEFLMFAGVQWWASWYPGAEPGGGGYIAQRILSSKNERHALGAVLFFQVAHYALRPWPWILVGLGTLILYPDLGASAGKDGYVLAMKDFLPVGLRGLMLVAFFAAYMSTIATHLNWGTSYLIQDLYRPYLRPGRSEKHYVRAAILTTVMACILSLIMTTFIERIEQAWVFILQFGAGTGLVLILRWYWWRVSAWSEIVAMTAPAMSYTFFALTKKITGQDLLSDVGMYGFTVTFTSVCWITASYFLPATDSEVLARFYRQTEPAGFWGPYRILTNEKKYCDAPLSVLAVCWLAGVVMVYGFLFAVGYGLLGYGREFGIALTAGLSGAGIVLFLSKKYPILG